MARVLAKFLVDEPEVLLHERDRARVYAAQIEVLLEQQEDLEQRGRLAREHLVVGRLEIAVAALEARAERERRLVLVEQNRLLEELQQHLVEPADLHDRPVVALHELLDGERKARVLVAEHLRELHLMVEQKPVLAAPREQVQAEADSPQERLRLDQDPHLALGQELVLDELLETRHAEMPTREPADHLDVAEAPRAAFDVRLEVVGGVVVAAVARGLLVYLRAKELRAVPHSISADPYGQLREQPAGTVQEPRLHQRRQHRHVAARLRLAIIERADAVPGLEPDVPEEREEAADRLVRVALGLALEQHEQIDVGLRM